MNYSGGLDPKTVIGASGLILMVIGSILLFSGTTLAQQVVENYYYAATGLEYDIVTFTPADNGTTVNVSIGVVDVNITVFTPANVNVSVWVSTQPLSVPQIIALGAEDPSFLGQPFLLTDIIINWSVQAPPQTPVVRFDIEVPRPDVTAFYWDGSQWLAFEQQEVVQVEGALILTINVTQQLTGTPVALIVPVAVGGVLENEAQGLDPTGLLLIALGGLLVGIAVVLYYVERARR